MVREIVPMDQHFGKTKVKKQKKDKIILVLKPRDYYASRKHSSKKRKKPLILKWGLGLGAFASLIALGGVAAATWHIIDNNNKLTGVTSESTSIALKPTLNNYLKSYMNPDNENAVLQQDIKNLGNMAVTQSSLASSEVAFTDYFLAQAKMVGKGIANVNDKVEALWNNFIDDHFMKASVSGTTVTNDPLTTSSAGRSALDSLSDTTGPLGISSNLFVGSTADPKTLHVTGDTILDSSLDVRGDIEVRSTTNLLGDVTVGSTTTPADLTVTGEANLLNKVTIGTSTTSADLDVTGQASVEGVSSLLSDVTIGSTTGTAANLLVSGTTEVRGTTSLLADVTVGSTTSSADLTVTGETNLLNRVTVGSSTTPADLDVTGEASVEGVSSLLGDVTIGSTTGTAANLLVSGTTEVRGTTSLLADVTVGSITSSADLTVIGETNLLNTVTVGTSTTPADLDVTGGLSVAGVFSPLGNVTIGSTTGTAANLLVTGSTQVRGRTNLLADVTVGSTTTAADLTVTGTTNLQGDLNLGTIGANGILGDSDDSTTLVRGIFDFTDARILGLSLIGGAPTSSEIFDSSSSINMSHLGINTGDKINLFVKLKISGGNTYEYLQMKQVTVNTSINRIYKIEFPFTFSVYKESSAGVIPHTIDILARVERRVVVDVSITSLGNISIRTPTIKQHQYYIYPRYQNIDFEMIKGVLSTSGDDRLTTSKEYFAWCELFGDKNTNPTYSAGLVISKANLTN